MRERSGVTIMELLIAAAISVMVVAAASGAYVSGMQASETLQRSRTVQDSRVRFEDRITKLVRSAWIDISPTDRLTYFVGDNSNGQAQGVGSNNSDRLTFTAAGMRLSGAALNADSSTDFETLNTANGPQGGVTEFCLSMTPVGSPPSNVTGVIIREQHPADGDNTQGGTESVFDADVTSVSFEFFDGSDWQPTWSTVSGTKRLPSAVRITYQVKDETTQRVLVVRLPNSDVTSDNPVATQVTQ